MATPITTTDLVKSKNDPEIGLVQKVDPFITQLLNILHNNLYVMQFRQGACTNGEKIFYFSGDLKGARKRAEENAKLMNIRLTWVKPFITDLSVEEKAREEYLKSQYETKVGA